jgi:hypothetical protein
MRIFRYLEIIAVAFGFIWAIAYPFMTPYPLVDLEILMRAVSSGNMIGFYYAPWSLPFFKFLSILPVSTAGALVNLLSMCGFLFAIRLFKGNKILFFISYPLFYTIFYGQMDGIYAFGLALMCLALQRKNAPLAAVGWLIALTKWYVAFPLGVGLLWVYADHRLRLQVVGLVSLAFGLSLLIWQNWVMEWAARIQRENPTDLYGISSWELFGPSVLALWIPVLLSRQKDYRWWVATWALTTPYLHIHGLTHVLLFPVGAVGWLVQVNYFTGLIKSHYLLIVPLVVYVMSWLSSIGLRRSH